MIILKGTFQMKDHKIPALATLLPTGIKRLHFKGKVVSRRKQKGKPSNELDYDGLLDEILMQLPIFHHESQVKILQSR